MIPTGCTIALPFEVLYLVEQASKILPGSLKLCVVMQIGEWEGCSSYHPNIFGQIVNPYGHTFYIDGHTIFLIW